MNRSAEAISSRDLILATSIVVVGVLIFGFPSLYLPFGRDQGIHAFIGKLAGEGFVVYREIFNVKPPLTTVVHWLSQVLFGENMRAIRIMDLMIVGATAVMIQLLVTRHLRLVWLGALGGLTFPLLHYSILYWDTAQTDGWCNLFLVAAMLLYSRSLDMSMVKQRSIVLFIAGFSIGLAFWLKYTTAGLIAIFPLTHLAMQFERQRVLQDGLAVSAGFLACAITGFGILAAQGALIPFLDIQSFMRSYVGITNSPKTLFLSPLIILSGAIPVLIVAAIGFYIALKALVVRKRHAEALGLLLWFGAGWASTLAQGKAHAYHLLTIFPSIAVATAVGAAALISELRRWTGRSFEFATVIGLCIVFVLSTTRWHSYSDTIPVALGDEHTVREYWESHRFRHSAFDTLHNLALVDYLKENTLPCDTVFIWGFEPGVYFLAQRPVISRFVYNFPMFTAYYRQSYRDEFMGEITANPPVVFVVQREDRTPYVSGHNYDSAEVLEQFDELRDFVARNYLLRDNVTRFEVYFRKDILQTSSRSC